MSNGSCLLPQDLFLQKAYFYPFPLDLLVSAIAAAMLNVYIPLYLGDLVNKLSDCFSQKERIAALYGPAAKLCISYTLQDVAYFDIHSCSKMLDQIAADVQTFKSSFKQCVSHGLRSGAQSAVLRQAITTDQIRNDKSNNGVMSDATKWAFLKQHDKLLLFQQFKILEA
ncbi:unnamed protein product [Echinostoma caproni]|uniref:ABC transmembrane type-1 domain-containing protein n=1 Tax=Echinostoma caproni TaxID=27848 RepID=A0A183AVT7_9TREM|nr:unnamed protein product [Echinostoma caproni]